MALTSRFTILDTRPTTLDGPNYVDGDLLVQFAGQRFIANAGSFFLRRRPTDEHLARYLGKVGHGEFEFIPKPKSLRRLTPPRAAGIEPVGDSNWVRLVGRVTGVVPGTGPPRNPEGGRIVSLDVGVTIEVVAVDEPELKVGDCVTLEAMALLRVLQVEGEGP